MVWAAEQLCFSLERGYDGPLVALPEPVLVLGFGVEQFKKAQKEIASRLQISQGALAEGS
jgi:hypothetical protein